MQKEDKLSNLFGCAMFFSIFIGNLTPNFLINIIFIFILSFILSYGLNCE